jgi:hypothetical protein
VTSLIFSAVGDVSFAALNPGIIESRGVAWPFDALKPALEDSDVLFGSMESVAIPSAFPPGHRDPKGLISDVPGPIIARILAQAGFHFMNLATNHILDGGVVGMKYTRDCLEAAGIRTGGVGDTQAAARKLVVLERKGLRIGILCYAEDCNYTLGTRGPCFAYFEPEMAIRDVEHHRGSVDILVVSFHGDLEFMPIPSPTRRASFQAIAGAGADIVLGHHPHVPQGSEMVEGSLIVYSLGNCFFPARSSSYMAAQGPDTARSFVTRVTVTREGVQGFERIPFEIQPPPDERPALLDPQSQSQALAHFQRLDAMLYDEALTREVWRAVSREKFATYLRRALLPIREPGWKRRVRRVFRRFGFRCEPDMDLVINELVGRLCLTAENRHWMNEILAMGKEAWEIRNASPPDPYRRPHSRFDS